MTRAQDVNKRRPWSGERPTVDQIRKARELARKVGSRCKDMFDAKENKDAEVEGALSTKPDADIR